MELNNVGSGIGGVALGKNIGFFPVLYYPPTSTNVYIDQTLIGSLFAISVSRDTLSLKFTQGACKAGDPSMELLADPALDGILLLSPHVKEEEIGFLKNFRVPVVFLFFKPKDTAFAYVDMDNVKGARLAVEHLVSLGHRKIAFIGGDISLSSNARDRYMGYQEVLVETGIVETPAVVKHGDFSMTHGYEAMMEILNLPKSARPTAVFGATDMIAMGAMQACTQSGLRVPWDMSVVGFDDIETAETSDPPLTTIRQPFQEIGQKAVMLVDALISDPFIHDKHQVIAPALIVRSSSVAPLRA
jgi:DNA-binding LacI/PurR family transcriptional regulator